MLQRRRTAFTMDAHEREARVALARHLHQMLLVERISGGALATAALEFALAVLIADLGPERTAAMLAGLVAELRSYAPRAQGETVH